MSKVHCRQCLALELALEFPPEHALVYALSAGGVEVASAIAFFQGEPITWLQAHELSDAVAARPEVAGRAVLLVDDGLARLDEMLAAALALRNGNPARLHVITPWLNRTALARIGRVADVVTTMMIRPPRRVPYDEPADPEAAACFVRQAEELHRAVALDDAFRGESGFLQESYH
ncbi:MAG: hypothetical protein H0V89_08010 [Deltaproteobacteria bacterium]|nr:hypothetical protein [Deltaproteobacteria bacterium]